MALTVWNVRGLNHPTRQLEIRKLLGSLNSEIFGLLETKIKSENFEEILKVLEMVGTMSRIAVSPHLTHQIPYG